MKNTGLALLLLLLVTAALHLAFEFSQPAPKLFGDEKHYLELARADAPARASSWGLT